MRTQSGLPRPFVLPLPGFVAHRYTAVAIAVVHLYLSFGHLSPLLGGDLQWTHLWKGFGSLAGAYVFAALATREFARRRLGARSSSEQIGMGSSSGSRVRLS